MHLGEFSFEIGFMAISEDHYASYMKDFWNELNKDMEMRREGRCIIGKNPDGSDKLCPYTRRCKGCPNKGLLERYNPKRWKSCLSITNMTVKPLTSKYVAASP